jgi:hypothetical protein
MEFAAPIAQNNPKGGMAALWGGYEDIPRFDIGGWYMTWHTLWNNPQHEVGGFRDMSLGKYWWVKNPPYT